MSDWPLADLAAGSVRLLLDLLLVGTPLAIGVVGALRTSRAGHPRVRYGIAVLAFALATLLPMRFAFWPRPDQISTAAASAASLSVDNERFTGRGLAGLSRGITSAARPIAPALFMLWVAVAGFLIGREITGHVELSRSRRRWTEADEEMRRTLRWQADVPLFLSERDGPSALGLLNSAVVIPRGLPDALGVAIARQVAWHELSHARWRDPVVNAGLRLVRALLWPSLPLWALERAVRVEREAAADWAAVTRTSRIPSPELLEEYASALVAVARWTEDPSRGTTAALAGTHAGIGSTLGERVTRLLRPRKSGHGRRVVAGLALVAGSWGALAMPATPNGTAAGVVGDTVGIDNPSGAPVVITAAALPVRPGEPLARRYSTLPVFTIRNASRFLVSRVVIGVWNDGELDARLLHREPLPPGSQVTIDPATGSPNVFAAPIAGPLVRVLAVEFRDGGRWAHPASPYARPSQPE